MSTSKTIAAVLFLITLVASCNAAENAATQPLAPAILIFGDSTVDTRNNNYYSKANFRANHILTESISQGNQRMGDSQMESSIATLSPPSFTSKS